MKFLVFSFAFFGVMLTQAQQDKSVLLVGTYTHPCSGDGIYTYEFNNETGNFRLLSSLGDVINPSYLTLSEDQKFIYSVNEEGNKSSISSFSFDKKSGKLDFINWQDSEGNDPCYIINDKKHIIVANYSGGTISVFGKNDDGGVTIPKQVIRHQGNSINKDRQEKPHVHMVAFSPDHKFLLANDLGTDELYVYSYHPNDKEILRLSDKIKVKPGSGPRHLVFSPNGKFVFLLNELDGSLFTFSYRKGNLTKVGETSIVPKDFKGNIGAADIHISKDGKFLYATNRGDANTISVFAVKRGKLLLVETIPSGGDRPRNFTLSHDDRFVLVANEKSGNIVVFERNPKTGKLTPTGKQIEVCAPVCLVFASE